MAEKDAHATKITNQFRSRTGFVYDLKADGNRLTVSIAERQGPGDPGDWHVEAGVKSPFQTAPIEAWSTTRRDALREVGRQWSSKAMELGLPNFDWEAIATALSDVRAL